MSEKVGCMNTGSLAGPANVLIDLGWEDEARLLRSQAARCRRLADSISDEHTAATLMLMAAEYEEKARSLRA
jgi:hypothetical protein